MPGIKCGGCGRFISTLEGARCGKCQVLYHRVCVGVPTKANISINWRCPDCKKNIARDNRTETPVRGATQSPPPANVTGTPGITGSSTPNSPEVSSRYEQTQTVSPVNAASTPPAPEISIADATTRELSPVAGTDLRVIIEELRMVRAEIQVFRKEMEVEMAELKTTLNTCSTRIDSLEARVDALERRAASGSTNSANVDKIVEELRREVNDRDQDLLANDIEVSNLPEGKAENPAHIIKVIGHKLGVSLDDRDIVSAERVGSYQHVRQLNSTRSAGPNESRPRPIVVRFARRDLRDQLLASMRVRRPLPTWTCPLQRRGSSSTSG